jgi:arsenate reductase-like glutaredoxin family protein
MKLSKYSTTDIIDYLQYGNLYPEKYVEIKKDIQDNKLIEAQVKGVEVLYQKEGMSREEIIQYFKEAKEELDELINQQRPIRRFESTNNSTKTLHYSDENKFISKKYMTIAAAIVFLIIGAILFDTFFKEDLKQPDKKTVSNKVENSSKHNTIDSFNKTPNNKSTVEKSLSPIDTSVDVRSNKLNTEVTQESKKKKFNPKVIIEGYNEERNDREKQQQKVDTITFEEGIIASNNQKLIASNIDEYYDPIKEDIINQISMRTSKSVQIEQIWQELFKKEEYEKTRLLLNQIYLENKTLKDSELIISGILNLGRYQDTKMNFNLAEKYFNEVIKKTPVDTYNPLQEIAEWYLSYVFLKQNKIMEAKIMLSKIISDERHEYYNAAENILQSLD